VLLNAHNHAIAFTVPHRGYGHRWDVVLDTAQPDVGEGMQPPAGPGAGVQVGPCSTVVLRCTDPAVTS
jgi:hypothetical protein